MNILTPWTDYFVAQAGAAGALTGLIFVALSFNFDQIISDDLWLGRAGTGLILLAQPIAYALVCLWPTRTAGPRQPGPPRDLYSRRLRRRCRQVTHQDPGSPPPGRHSRQAAPRGRSQLRTASSA